MPNASGGFDKQEDSAHTGSGLTALSSMCSADYRVHPRGNEEEQHLRADNGWADLVQCDELRGVEQEGGVGCRTSH